MIEETRYFADMFGKLYIVATPIGNREDITARARRVLVDADIVAAEDTRVAQKLFAILGIQNKVVSNHKFNEEARAAELIAELKQGKNVAIVSDAGTPCISDPGYIIVKRAAKEGIEVVGVSGPSAIITALSVSGFEPASFAFYGFFPRGNREARAIIKQIKKVDIPVSGFFESPKRIKKTMTVIAAEFPDSEICLCNDLTKLYEKIYRGMPEKVLAELDANPSAEKGEYTIVMRVKPVPAPAEPSAAIGLEAMIVDYIIRNGGSAKDATAALHKEHGIPKKELYAAALKIKAICL